jgi:hypothetical protein
MSIKSFYNLYGDAFDYNVLYNNLSSPLSLDFSFVKIHNQAEYSDTLPYPPWDCCWKLYPPRLNMGGAEIWMDNDFILAKKIPEIDALIDDGIPFMTQGLMRNYGRYDNQVKRHDLNCGFFGLPYGFDFAKTIVDICKHDVQKKWVDHYDDQGVVASTMCRFPKFNILSLKRIPIVGPSNRTCPDDKEGYHFVYMNRINLKHPGWGHYMRSRRNNIKFC